MLVIAAVAMVAMVGLAAFTIDVGTWFQTKRQAQTAADAAALAGSQELSGTPESAKAADARAKEYVEKNSVKNTISGGEAGYEPNYEGSPACSGPATCIKVTVSKTAEGFFAKVLGINSAKVKASAVAKRNTATNTRTNPSALFAHGEECKPGITVSGAQMTVKGAVHSNGRFEMSGSENHFGPTTYGGPQKCEAKWKEGSDTFENKTGKPEPDYKLEPWPIDYSESPPPCEHGSLTAPRLTWTKEKGEREHGIFCAKEITIEQNGTGTVTFYAERIGFSGANISLKPAWQGRFQTPLLFYQTGKEKMQLKGAGFNAGGGSIFAPNAELQISGAAGRDASAYVEGKSMTISGKEWILTGTGPPEAGPPELATGSALVE